MKHFEFRVNIEDDVNPEGVAAALEQAADQLRQGGKLTTAIIHEVRASGVRGTHRVVALESRPLHEPGVSGRDALG